MTYFILKFLHVMGAIVILGTGTGIAFFMLMAHLSRDVRHIARTAATVVLGDYIFTATAVIVQPITGYLLVYEVGYSMTDKWILVSLVLYVVAGIFWVPVVGIQRRMRNLAQAAADGGMPLPDEYFRLFRIWFWFGFPGFGSVVAIVWLMIAKPVLW
ncbi:MAG TPA: DUF2269 domain-containing protein [Xanthobacteraceae bacterium]|jgi:uncharacterized membrane protein|nr:DUF2269 domain-containing protein [Xanthobacteraceae bacterium]